MEQILRHARKNAETIEQIVTAYLERYIQTQGS
jgi:hypothetical protein